jgi:Tetracyclin repressor-like, C-terminal domain
MDAVAEAGFTRLSAALEAADATAEGRAALTAQGLAYLAFAEAQPAVFRLMFQRVQNAADRDSPARKAAYDALARRAAALAPDKPEAAALMAWGLVHGLADLRLNGAPAAARAEDAVRLLVELLAPG